MLILEAVVELRILDDSISELNALLRIQNDAIGQLDDWLRIIDNPVLHLNALLITHHPIR